MRATLHSQRSTVMYIRIIMGGFGKADRCCGFPSRPLLYWEAAGTTVASNYSVNKHGKNMFSSGFVAFGACLAIVFVTSSFPVPDSYRNTF